MSDVRIRLSFEIEDKITGESQSLATTYSKNDPMAAIVDFLFRLSDMTTNRSEEGLAVIYPTMLAQDLAIEAVHHCAIHEGVSDHLIDFWGAVVRLKEFLEKDETL